MNLGDALWVFLVSAVPIVELRLAIPLAVNEYHIDWYYAFLICLTGNILPVPFILKFLGPFSELMSKMNIFNSIIQWVFKYTRRRGGLVEKYGQLGLVLLVAIPLPGTGAWTGSLVAFLLGIDFKTAFYSILIGVIIAGIIVTILSLLGWTGAIIAGAILFVFIILNFWKKMRA